MDTYMCLELDLNNIMVPTKILDRFFLTFSGFFLIFPDFFPSYTKIDVGQDLIPSFSVFFSVPADKFLLCGQGRVKLGL